MSNLLDIQKIFNKTSRNGFDLTQRVGFSAKAGQMLPVGVYEVLPGDTFKIDLQSFTRTIPLNSSAYARVMQYFDVYYVRTNDLWDKFDLFALQLQDNVNRALNLAASQRVSEFQPYFTRKQIAGYVYARYSKNDTDVFGFSKWHNTVRLLEYLGYGTFYTFEGGEMEPLDPVSINDDDNLRLNPFPLLAYHFIWQNCVRNSQWENSAPFTCNVNYIMGVDDLQLDVESLDGLFDDIFSLKYSNYDKDYFFGLLPRAQFGDTATISLAADKYESMILEKSGFNTGDPAEQSGTVTLGSATDIDGKKVQKLIRNNVDANLILSASDIEKLLSVDKKEISALAIRQLEYLQKYKEILQTGNRNVKDVLKQIYGVDTSNEDNHLPIWLGGYSAPIDINEVINQNLSTEQDVADIRGKGISYGKESSIDFTAKFHGIIMVMYHAQPILDYATSGISKLCMKTKYTDYAIPVFDRLGFQKLSVYELISSPVFLELLRQKQGVSTFLGYGPIYLDNKTNYDKMLGAFRDKLKYWACPLTDEDIINLSGTISYPTEGNNAPSMLNANFFRVNPRILDNIFTVKADDTVNTDPFLVNMNQQVNIVRNLDRDGLPY